MSSPVHHEGEEETVMFFDTLFSDLGTEERIEIRYGLPGESSPMSQRFCGYSSETLRKSQMLACDHDVYFGVCPRMGEVGSKDGVSRLLSLWADVDVKGLYTEEDRRRQLASLSCLPSMLVWSGGGYHPYWLLAEPAVRKEDLRRCEEIMKRLAAKLEGDPVHDRSRILRVPGTFNHKLGYPRPVKLVEHYPERRYTLEQLEEMVGPAPEAGNPFGESAAGREVLGTLLEKGHRNSSLASVAGSLRDRGLDGETILAVLQQVNRRRCSPPLDEAEVGKIAKSISRYESGSPRYLRSTARRIYRNKEQT